MRLLSDTELREAMVRDYVRAYRAAGVREDEAKSMAESRAVTELLIVDAAKRDGLIGSNRAAKVETASAEPQPDVVGEAYAANGMARANGTTLRYRVMHQRPQHIAERWGYACARINRILEGAGGSPTFEQAVKNATIPKLAAEYADLFGWWLTMTGEAPPPGTPDRNPFRGMSAKDAARKFVRMVEDICDRSTGVLGGWYVK